MSELTAPRLPLTDGAAIPQVGYGLYKVPAADARRLMLEAIDVGYRHLDTAAFYGNEREVGEAVRDAPVARDELFVTSKVWKSDNGFDETLRAFDESMDRFGLEQLDLYLIHWPVPSTDRYVDTWRALIRLQQERRVRSIGVANFHAHHIRRIVDETGVWPVVNQVELHPWLPQTELREFDDEHEIRTEAWSPLARGRVLDDTTLAAIGAKHARTPAQIVLRWHVQLGNVVIPKASSAARLRENLDVFGFTLDAEDLAAIAALESGERTGRDPDLD
ncbi:aldo/keto reductase [Agromyces aerolatus]|uniref:aldo/keto reductase n=1 Tax=Agromyces sp. LY-1074 TaxID=3074080 RepID=UPI00285A7AD6|nr:MULTISPECIES: aldo/keto reductase [unclassified Agromyces]MDR5699803.1 aldo/keto reductase [Agromyces sp. LY-1074]MDR5706099.1 aldo/keto reductase [Agromyces sp. LY-1358]